MVDPISVRDAAELSKLTDRSIRYYIDGGRLEATRIRGKLHVSRSAVERLMEPTPLSRTAASQARIIAVANQKGGTGKTTTAIALATLLSRDAAVLAIDCDAQGNMTQAFGLSPDRQECTLYNVFVDDMRLEDAIREVGPPTHHLSIVPGNIDLSDLWQAVRTNFDRDKLLRNAIESIIHRFDYIILDCPPSLDMMITNALVAATEVIVPVDMSVFSVRGLVKLDQTMRQARRFNKALRPPLVIATKTNNTSISADIEREIRANFTGQIFRLAIPLSKDVPESHAAEQALPYYAPGGKVAQAYEALAEEIRSGSTAGEVKNAA